MKQKWPTGTKLVCIEDYGSWCKGHTYIVLPLDSVWETLRLRSVADPTENLYSVNIKSLMHFVELDNAQEEQQL